MKISYPLLAVVLSAGLFPACHDDSPRSATVTSRSQKARPPAAAPAPVRSVPTRWVPEEPESEPQAPALDHASVLDDEERRLLEADDATLTREDRVARAYAQKKLVMADPEHPLRPVVEKLEQDVESGEYATMARGMFGGGELPDQDQADASAQL